MGTAILEQDAQATQGADMYALVEALYPYCRSITGDGLRKTLRTLQEHIPLAIHEVPTGTKVLDWTVPKEWNIRDAYIKDASGERVVDFRASNLHVVGYSTPVRRTMTLEALRPHLHTLPEQPDWIPYRTAYYDASWGFCLRHRTFEAMAPGSYEVCIDASLEDGALSYGEYVLPGATTDEVLISCHSCHPSLANDNLSGIALGTFLAKALRTRLRRYTYRFLFAPGTIGAIAWLARNEDRVHRIRHGLIVACVGDPGPFHYKQSRRGHAEIDRVVAHVLERSGAPFEVRPFTPYGYDERQYNSPGFDLPVGRLTRTPNGAYPEYHTSADDLDLVRPDALGASLARYLEVIDLLEANRTYVRTDPRGEPQLGRRGLYDAIGGYPNVEAHRMAMLWVLNLADGTHDVIDMAERAGIDAAVVCATAELLKDHDLLTIPPADHA